MNLSDTDIASGRSIDQLQTSKHFGIFCDHVYRAACAHENFRAISTRISAYIGSTVTVKEAYAKLDFVKKRVVQLLNAKKIDCFNRHELNPLGNKIDLPEPKIIFPLCNWKAHRSCGHPDYNGNLGILARSAMLLPDIDSTEIIMPAINMISRDVMAAKLSSVHRFNNDLAPGVDQFEEAERVFQLTQDEQLQNDGDMVQVLSVIHTAFQALN